MSRRSIIAVFVLLAAACGPEVTPPGAAGQIALAPGVDATGFTHAQLRLAPNEGGGTLDLNEVIADGDDAEASVPLEDLPMDYELVHDSESSDVETWRLTVWLSTTETANAPADGDLLGTEPFELEDCTALFGERTYCGTKDGVDVLIDGIVQVQ